MSRKYDSINLGQGFPNWEAPPFLLEAAKNALSGYSDGDQLNPMLNQYARPGGHMRLVNALS